MDFLASHRAHVGEDAERLIAVVEGVFGVVRKPLIEQLRNHRAFLAENIVASPLDAIAVYGLTPADCTDALMTQSEHVRDETMLLVDVLVYGLEKYDATTIGRFVRALMASCRHGVELCGAAKAGNRKELIDGQGVLAADSAYHLYKYFVTMIERVLESSAPTSALALRGKR